MSARLVDGACIALPLLGAGLDEQGMVDSPAVSGRIHVLLAALRDGVSQAAAVPFTPVP